MVYKYFVVERVFRKYLYLIHSISTFIPKFSSIEYEAVHRDICGLIELLYKRSYLRSTKYNSESFARKKPESN